MMKLTSTHSLVYKYFVRVPTHLKWVLIATVSLLDSLRQCFGRAIEVKPDEGHSKYMNMGQLLGGADAIECFSRGLALMVKEQSEQTEAVRTFIIVY